MFRRCSDIILARVWLSYTLSGSRLEYRHRPSGCLACVGGRRPVFFFLPFFFLSGFPCCLVAARRVREASFGVTTRGKGRQVRRRGYLLSTRRGHDRKGERKRGHDRNYLFGGFERDTDLEQYHAGGSNVDEEPLFYEILLGCVDNFRPSFLDFF